MTRKALTMTTQLTTGQRKIAAAQRPTAAAYWAGQLAGARDTGFPPDRPRAPRTGGTRTGATLPVEPALAARLHAVSRGDATTLHTVLTAGAVALLRYYTGESDLLAGRPAQAADALARVLPARVALEPDDTLRTLLTRLRATVLDALPHEDYPVDLAGTGVELVVALADLHGPEVVEAVAADTLFLVRREHANLVLEVRTEPQRLLPGTAARLGDHYLRLLTAALAAPDAALESLELADDADLAVAARANDTRADFPRDVSLPELFARRVAAHPDDIAVEESGRRLTFAELDLATGRLARVLRERGVGPGVVVGVHQERAVELLVAVNAILRAGGAYLPVDVALPPARIAYLLRDSGTTLVLAQPGKDDQLPAGVEVLALTRELMERGDAAPPLPPAPGDAAYVIYTSGSTGNPKGVVVEHRSVVNRLHWMQQAYPIGPGDAILQKTPTSFDVSVWELFWWHIDGARVVLLPPGGEREPEAIVDAIERHGVTTVHFVPTMLGAFLDYVAETGAAHRLSSLRRVFASGEALGTHHARRFAELLGHARLINLYGPTEATVDVSWYDTTGEESVVPIGLPISNTRLHVLDDRRRPRPVGVPGELWIAGAGLARGYLNRPALTAERFAEAPFPGEERAYRTGDLVRRLPDGRIEFLGRTDAQVKLRGYRIEPGEIEARLLEHAAVKDAAVLVRAGSDGADRLLGYVVAAGVTEEELRRHAAGTLPSYMVPSRITVLAAFPLSPSGKLDRRALPEPAAGGADHVAPRTERERQLAEVLAEVLGLERVGVHDNFFALGGTSIHFVGVLAQARKRGLGFTFQQLFSRPTVAELAAVAGDPHAAPEERHEFAPFELVSAEDRARLPQDLEDAYPMSLLQAGTIFQSEMTRGSSQYHDIIGYLIRSSFDAGVFAEAVRILVEQNPVFRTSYRLTGFSDYLQLVHRTAEPLPFFVADLRHLGPGEQDDWYARWERQEKAHAFDWQRPGLVRLHVHVLRDDLYRYSISQHNSALDGWSINAVHTKLFEIYYALLRDGRYDGEPAPNHMRNFVGLEQQSLRSAADRSFWLDSLRDRPRSVVPRWRPVDEEAGFDVILHDVALPRGLSDRIVALAGRLGLPVKTVLLAAHLKVLSVVTGEADVLTGYEHSGRPEVADGEKATGLFLNSVPLRLRLGQGSWEELVRQVFEHEAAFLPHRRYPMAKMKQDLQTQEPLFETVFNFTHFYSLKRLRSLGEEFSMLDVRAVAITEFALRSEFSRHYYTDEVQLSLHYHVKEFDHEQIVRIGGYFVTVLDRMTADPAGTHATSTLLPAAELAELAGHAAASPVAPAAVAPVAGAPAAAPASEVLRVASIWGRVLGEDPETFALDDDFFELGGNSLSAMRVVMMLDGLAGIKDVMRNSRLGELAALVAATGAAESEGVLVRLTPPIDEPEATLVCFPYGAGHAVHFRPVADAVRRLSPATAVLAAELPGHDPMAGEGELTTVAETARRVVEELGRARRGRVVLWGHCVGSAVALEVAALLAAAGTPAEHLFIGAKLLYPAEAIRESIAHVSGMTYEDITHWLTVETGFTGVEELGPGYADVLVRTFRHDSVSANEYYLAGYEGAAVPAVTTPTTVVAAKDDPITEGFADRAGAWELFTGPPRLRELTDGGHYFTRTRPAEVAALVREVLHSEEGN